MVPTYRLLQHYRTDYFICKGWHSVTLQSVVDGMDMFWNVFAGLPGSLHDACVLRLSTLWELASCGNFLPAHIRSIGVLNTGYYILGDTAYPLQGWLETFLWHWVPEEQNSSCSIKKIHWARLVVENVFGLRCLMKRNDCDVQLGKSMSVTCYVLHNLCEDHGETWHYLGCTCSCRTRVCGCCGVRYRGGAEQACMRRSA